MNIIMKGMNKDIAVINSNDILITDAQSALDLAMTIQYQVGAQQIVLPKSCIAEDFFILSTRLAGEILQKYINYHIRLAIVGDFSSYTSKPLRDFIYESNNGKYFFFVPTETEAIEKMEKSDV